MNAVILAAGLGKRLLPMTETIPKALVEIKGRPIIYWVLDAVPDKISHVIIVTGYLGEQITELIGEEYEGKRITYSKQGDLKGNLEALRSAIDQLDDRFLMLQTDDMVCKRDLDELIKHELGTLVIDFNQQNHYGVCKLNGGNHVKEFIEKPIYTSKIIPGPYVLDKRIFDIEIQPNDKGEYVVAEAVNKMIATTGARVRAVEAHGWETLTSPNDHRELNEKDELPK